MATPLDTVIHTPVAPDSAVSGHEVVDRAAHNRWARWLWPSFFDVILIALPVWFFGVAGGGVGLLLADGDTGWHIRTGDWILAHRSFIHGDIFSFSKAGEPWFAWEWLSDVIFSALHSSSGLQGIALFGIVAAVLYCGLIFRHMVWRGANMFVAIPLVLLGFGAATVHLLARPHLFTLVLVPAVAWLIQADLRRPGPRIWALVGLALLWANLHGGWLALIALLALTAVGLAAESLLGKRQWKLVRRYCLLALACLAVSLVNPYGWRLHAHIWQYLNADWIKSLVGEFRSPEFRGETMAAYEFILLASGVAAGAQLLRREIVAPLWILFWAHSSLESGRHIPLFVAVALPFLAAEIQRAWDAWAEGRRRNSVAGILNALAAESAPNLTRTSLWPGAVLALTVAGFLPLKSAGGFPSERFPVKLVNQQRDRIAGARIFTEDQWADYLIYRFSPGLKVFFDGRSDFYGKDLTLEYCRMMDAQPDWERLLDKYRFDAVLIRPKMALAAVLKVSPRWRVVQDDGWAILFVPSSAGVPSAGGAFRVALAEKSRPRPNEMP